MNAYTPAPWCVDVTRKNRRAPVTGLMVVAEAGGMPGVIINLGGTVTATDWANARVIAEAPAMADALTSTGEVLKVLMEYVQADARALSLVQEEYAKGRAILARLNRGPA